MGSYFILLLPKASEVFRYVNPGRGVEAPKVREDWHDVSIPIMLTAVREKFNQNKKLKDILVETINAILVEDTGRAQHIQQGQKIDDFYGAGLKGKGQNLLGQILMRVRDELVGNVDPNEDFICYLNADDYFNKENGKVCIAGSVKPKKTVQKKITKQAVPKKIEKAGSEFDHELTVKLKILHSKLRELLKKLNPQLPESEVFTTKEEEPIEEIVEEEFPYSEWLMEAIWS